ncbi:MAG: glycosyltransferase family 2 protein [Candidatus Omnitrophica bacterium]|nr:glycosyltransferase family 2 protein [Candidatus Omnitrophota bacterium]MDD5053424.1 glycosyltransferase family 2 protein [Sulfuricurvum sp.]
MSNSGILISACMMVKNEEKNLERCLNSVKLLADEIVIVDTGSTDNTIEIAKKFNARIYEHPWANDFSLHRNQSISYAKGKWILIIDADEELCFVNKAPIKNIKRFFKECKYNAAALVVKDIQKELNVLQFNSTRFFKKNRVRYEGIVHNQPKIEGQALFCPMLEIKHYGYDLTPEQKEAKFKRTSTLLLKQVETGEVHEGLPYFYLCQLYANNDCHEEAIKWGEKYLTCKEEANSHFNQSLYFTMIKQLMKIGDKKRCKEWLNIGLEDLPGDLDLAMAALEYGVWVQDEELALNAAKDFCSIFGQWQNNPALKKNRFVYTMRPEALTFAMFHLCSIQMQQGAKHLQILIQLLSKTSAPYKEGMLRELEAQMAKTIFPIKFKAIQPVPVANDLKEDSTAVFTTRSLQ